jgi:multisubunit Na+/H+ antiporter MnhE subunit
VRRGNDQMKRSPLYRRVFYAVVYFFRFLKELAMANYQVTKLVLAPQLPIKPGFVSIPLDAKTDFEITSFANSITLTPGTISVHIPDDRHAIVIHAIDVGPDLDALRSSIKASLEAPILRFTR